MHDNMSRRYPTKRVLNQWGCLGLRHYPSSKVSKWWIRLPITKGEWRNYALRMAPEQEKLLGSSEVTICNSELIRHGSDFYVHLKVKKPVCQVLRARKKMLAVDIGERNIATSVVWDGSSIRKPRFHAREVRGLRRHYGWLRRRLQELRNYRTLSRIHDSERRRVQDLLHKASRKIVNQAQRETAAIAIGDLKGLRQRVRRGAGAKGKRFARTVHSMPYHQLTKFIRYKAAWAGIPVIMVNEAGTSRQCHVCNSDGRRPSQGLFLCGTCGWQGHADINGAANIAKRAWSYMLLAGAPGSEPEGGQPEFNRGRPIRWPVMTQH